MRRRWSDRSSRRVRTLVTQLARSRLIRESGRMRADIHDGPEQTLQSEAGYSNARPHQPGRRKTSCTARPDHTDGSNATEMGYLGDVRFPPDSDRTSDIPGRQLRADSVEKGGSNSMYLLPTDAAERNCRPLCGLEDLHRDQLGHLAKVLGGRCEGELVMRAVWAS